MCQVTFDPKDLSKDVYTVRFASLPSILYAFREDEEFQRITAALAATTGISVDAINKNGGVFGGGLSGGENGFFRKNLGIRF
jgi:hypothetical protein